MADLQQTVGAVIRKERRRRRRTMKSVAQEAAVSLVYLGEIEHGKKYPSALVLERLSQALGLAVSDLLVLVAMELRGAAQQGVTNAVGFSLPVPEIAVQGATATTPLRRTELRAVA